MIDTVDYSALESRVSRRDVRAFLKQERTRRSNNQWTALFAWLLLIVFLAPVLGSVIAHRDVGIILAMFGLVAGAVLLIYCVNLSKSKKSVRLKRFATANGLMYEMYDTTTAHQGLIFQHGHSRLVSDKVWSDTHRFSFANYKYEVGSGKNRQVLKFHYVAVKLPRRLPHMVLDATSNNRRGASNLPVAFRKNQRLQLEGDFNKYFTLYCPRQYERDALYIFTPDIMALVIDLGANHDIEIIDDKLYLYGSGYAHFTREEYLKKIFAILTILGKKMRRRVNYYVDERVSDRTQNTVDDEGARLRQQRLTMVGLIAVIVTIAAIIWTVIHVVSGTMQ